MTRGSEGRGGKGRGNNCVLIGLNRGHLSLSFVLSITSPVGLNAKLTRAISTILRDGPNNISCLYSMFATLPVFFWEVANCTRRCFTRVISARFPKYAWYLVLMFFLSLPTQISARKYWGRFGQYGLSRLQLGEDKGRKSVLIYLKN